LHPREEAKQLVRGLSQRMGSSAYDVAWLARLKDPATGEARWPDLADWLLEHQRTDGSWGGEIVYYHDRILCTLAAAVALSANGWDGRARKAVVRAERYLWHHLHFLPRDPFELSGFELIFPMLLDKARTMGLDVPTHTCGYGEIQTAKLRLIPPDLLYSPRISTVYSLEFLGPGGDVDRLSQALASNGALGDSPATTAYYLLRRGDAVDERALAYLEHVRARDRIVTVYPFRVFELSWVLNNLLFSGLPIDAFADAACIKDLWAQMTPEGAALDPTFGIADGDITSVCCHVLRSAGYDVDPAILARFEDPKTRVFHTYQYERNISMSTNIHALDALNLMPDYPGLHETKEEVIVTLLDNRKYNIYWFDKWHASPYYTTAHALVALLREGAYLAHACQHTVDWMVHTQHRDGSWGFFQEGTVEETAYALTALLHYHRYEPIDVDVLHRGAAYLARGHEGPSATYPELWLAKSTYAPYDIIRSAILTALILYEEMFGRPAG